ncbi:hypothetical protein [Polaromonas sp. UC242_47]|uniref:hypothetical protein n=1 Tax=Polaromonas sp. UC242_47 TaxID=3374626 RepID=UPI0037A2AB38
MSVNNISENFIASILAAAVIALIVFMVSAVRNFLLERAVKGAITSDGVGMEFSLDPLVAEFSVQIHNYANASIRVRAIVLICDKFHVELTPSRDVRQTPLTNEITRKKFPRTHFSHNVLALDENPHAVLLPSKTMSFWRVGTQTISSREWIVEKVYVVFEYATMFGNVAMVRMSPKDSAFKLIKKNFESLARSSYRKQPMPEMAITPEMMQQMMAQGIKWDGRT